MAWIKLETHTFDKVEIYTIAEKLSIDADSVVGKCCRIWGWFDANTTDGVTKSVTKALLDRQCGVIGFCNEMIDAGWMADDGENIMLPFYDRHNSATAKSRALGTKRQAKYKSNAGADASGDAEGDASADGEALPKSSHRGEERRGDINTPEKPSPKKRKPAMKPMPDDFCISERVIAWASEKGFSQLERRFEQFVGACTAKGYVYADWDQAFMNAVREDWAKLGKQNSPTMNAKPKAGDPHPDPRKAEAGYVYVPGIGYSK